MRTEILAFAALWATSVASATQTDPVADQLKSIEERYADSLVRVRYTQQVSRSTAEPPEEDELTTTGVLVSEDGLVMVSAIVYEPFTLVPHGVGIRFPASVTRVRPTISEARVRTIDGTEYPAALVGRDPDADVAFFRIEAADKAFTPVDFGSGADVSVGDAVVVVSLLPEPLGPALAVELSRVQAVTSGASGYLVGTGSPDPVGSLLVSKNGTVLGFLDAITVPVPDTRSRNPLAFMTVVRELPKGIGRGFARPATIFADAGVRVTETDPVRRGWLGVEMQALSKKLAGHLELPVDAGIILGYVYRNSPAERAGLEVGDVLVALEGDAIRVNRDEDIGSFAERVLKAGPGATLEVAYLRDGEKQTTSVELQPAPRSAREAQTVKVDELDITVRELTYDYLATRFLEPDQNGVVVVQPPVAVSSNPNRVGPGDLLVRLDDQDVNDLESFREVVADIRTREPDEVVLFVERGQQSFFFAVKPDWD